MTWRPVHPSPRLRASTTLDLPEPLGPTTQVIPGSKLRVVADAKDLNPRKVKLLRYNVPPLDGVSSGVDPAAEGDLPSALRAQLREPCRLTCRRTSETLGRSQGGSGDCRQAAQLHARGRLLALHRLLRRCHPMLAAHGGEGPELVQKERRRSHDRDRDQLGPVNEYGSRSSCRRKGRRKGEDRVPDASKG